MRYGELAKYLTLWRTSEEYGFLREGPVHTQQQALKRLERALWEGRDTTDASGRWLEGWLSSHSPDRLFAEVFG